MKALRYFTAAAVLVAWTACTNEELESGGFANDPDAVRIVATVGDLQSRSNPIDENGADPTKFNNGDKIRVKTEDQDYVVYTYNGTSWIPEYGKYLKWNKETHRFSASYPIDIFDIQRDQSTIEGLRNSDLMEVDNLELSKKNSQSIALKFNRRYARVVISKTIDWGTQYDDTYSVSDLQINTIANNFIITPYNGKDNYYAIVFSYPKAVPEDVFITFKVKSNRPGSQEITHTITGIPHFEAGKSYQFELRIGKDKAEISSVTVEDWQTGSVVDGDKETTEAPDYKTSVANGITTYHVYTAKGLQDVNAIMTDPNVTKETLASNIKLEGNITLPAVAEGESNWTPIGVYTEGEKGNAKIDLGYTGTFDGNGYTITGLVIHSENSYQGLLGYLDGGGVIKNLTLANCSIKGGRHTAAFVGWSYKSSIENCSLIATTGKEVRIESGSYYIGGIVGQSFGTVSGCSLIADGGSVTIASTDDHVGGIVGNAGSYSYTSGCQVLALNGGTIAIKGDERTGGIAGDVINGEGTERMAECQITNNGGTITVTGIKDVGGAAGYIHWCIVRDCLVTGVQVSGTTQVGGFTGRNGQKSNATATIVGSNIVKNCTVKGTDETTVKWDVGLNYNASHTPEITDGGGNTVNIVTE